jgi:hypothetical protein
VALLLRKQISHCCRGQGTTGTRYRHNCCHAKRHQRLSARLLRQYEGVLSATRLHVPYVIDTTQQVAHAYDAQCTPDFFGFNAQDELQYRGRLDASRMQPTPNARRDLFEAMKQVAETGRGPEQQIPLMGCSIKWK